MIVGEYHLDTYWHFMFPIDSPDTIIAEGQSRHEGQSRPPSVRPARHLRALHRHIFVLFVVTPRAHSSSAAPKWMRRKRERERKKGRRKREKTEEEKRKGLGDWPADWRLDRNCNGVESWSRRHSMSLSSPSAAAARRSLIPHEYPCPVTKAKKVREERERGGIHQYDRAGRERSWRKSPPRVYVSFAFVTDRSRLRSRNSLFAIIWGIVVTSSIPR